MSYALPMKSVTARNFTKYFLLSERREMCESSIVLIRAYEVYNKIQFVEDAGRRKTSLLTE